MHLIPCRRSSPFKIHRKLLIESTFGNGRNVITNSDVPLKKGLDLRPFH